MRRKLVAGNWKMNGSVAFAETACEALVAGWPSSGTADVAVFPPFPYLGTVQSRLRHSPIGWGAQNISQFPAGAYTGEVAGAMLQDFGCRYVLVGHSERRSLFAEGDSVVAAKLAAAVELGLVPVLCVGETLAEHESGIGIQVVARQVEAGLSRVDWSQAVEVVLAYEPVWAIGTGRAATPELAQDVHQAIRRTLARLAGPEKAMQIRILYGGSVKPDNAAALFAMPDVDGALVGGASLVVNDFLAICSAVAGDEVK